MNAASQTATAPDRATISADGLAVSPEQRESSIKQAVGETLRLAA